MQQQKHQQAKYYNRSARDLPSLKTGDAVYVKLVPHVRRWTCTIVIEVLTTRSYKVKALRGGIYMSGIESSSELGTQTQDRVSRL